MEVEENDFVSVSFLFCRLLCLNITDIFGRNSAYNGIGGYILCYDCPGRHYCPIADSHALQYGRVGTDPHIFPQYDRRGVHHASLLRIQVMIKRGEYHIMADQASVADGYAAVMLKVTAGIDEYMLSYGDVFTAVCVERRGHKGGR